MHPRVLVLDEPTSALDPTAAEDVLGVLARLVDDLGLTVLVAEHRMERVVPFADRLLLVEGGLVRGGAAGRAAGDLAGRAARRASSAGSPGGTRCRCRCARRAAGPAALRRPLRRPPARHPRPAGTAAGEAARRRRSATAAPSRCATSTWPSPPGEVTALMGRNGSGKTSLLWALQGTGRRDAGRVSVDGVDPAGVPAARARALVGLVPQTAADLLYLETVAEECAAADRQAPGAGPTCRELLDRMTPGHRRPDAPARPVRGAAARRWCWRSC